MWPRNGEFEYIKFVYVLCMKRPLVRKKSLLEWKPVPLFRFWNQISSCCRLVHLKKVVSETNHKNLVRFFMVVEDVVGDWEVTIFVSHRYTYDFPELNWNCFLYVRFTLDRSEIL
jgi:hypothetical protein